MASDFLSRYAAIGAMTIAPMNIVMSVAMIVPMVTKAPITPPL